MKNFNIRVNYITYSIQQNENRYSVFQDGNELFILRAMVGKNLVFHWETNEGEKSHLIDKIGLLIENHDIEQRL